MITEEIREELFRLRDTEYRDFQVRLIPSVEPDQVIGVRTPALRKYARQLAKRADAQIFLQDLPHPHGAHRSVLAHIESYHAGHNGAGHGRPVHEAVFVYAGHVLVEPVVCLHVIEHGVTEIERYAFMGSSRLRYLSLPNSLRTISLAAFEDCSSLQNFIIPEGVERIEQLAFSGCSSLTEMRIPSSVSSFGPQVFYRCKSLQAIHVAEDNPILSSVDGVLFNKDKTILRAYPNHHNNDYSTYTIPEGVITVADCASCPIVLRSWAMALLTDANTSRT